MAAGQLGVAQNETGEIVIRRFWSMFPLSGATHFGTGLLSHSQLFTVKPGRTWGFMWVAVHLDALLELRLMAQVNGS